MQTTRTVDQAVKASVMRRLGLGHVLQHPLRRRATNDVGVIQHTAVELSWLAQPGRSNDGRRGGVVQRRHGRCRDGPVGRWCAASTLLRRSAQTISIGVRR